MLRDLMQGVQFSHQLFKRHLQKGNLVVDATAGNGLDTEFLANLVGEDGRVIAFDIQKKAIDATEALLRKGGLKERVELYNIGHENLTDYIDKKIDGIMFNLGYLPGGNKEITTKPDTTLSALKSGLRLLKEGGLIVLVIYTGQPGGEKEREAIIDFTSELNMREYNVLHYHFINQQKEPPQVVAIKKRIGG